MSEDTTELPVAGQLQRLADHLRDSGLAVVNCVVPEAPGDGSATTGWLWVRSEPPLFPDGDYDLLVGYQHPGDGWSITRLDGQYEAIGLHPASLEAVSLRIASVLERPAGGGEFLGRDAGMVAAALGAVAATVVLPFMQVIVGKSAEDAYARLRGIFNRNADQPAADEPVPSRPRQLAVVDEHHGATLIAPDPVPAAALRQLLAIPASELRSHVHIWDETDQTWHGYKRLEPPDAQ